MNSLYARLLFSAVLTAATLSLAACDSENEGGGDGFTVTYEPPFNPSAFVADITNPYFPLVPGTTYRYEEEAEDGMEEVIVEVTNDTRQIAGVTARVVRDRVYLDGELIEDTIDWYAQDADGNVWYLGENTREYEDGEVVSTEGSWETGVDGAIPGIVMPAHPAAGQAYYQEFYEAEAEDRAEILSTNEAVTVPYGSFTNCVQTRDTTPLDPDVLEHKYYCAGIGTALEVNVETGGRGELVEITMP